jgi:hypothetical protein
MAASPPEPETPSSASMEKLIDYPDADITLRSSDNFDFRVQKLFIVKSSPVLNGIIQAASGNSEVALRGAREHPPVVQIPERGATLYNLFTFLLPMVPVLPSTVEETMELLSVAQKYEMSHVLMHIRGSISLNDPPLINKNNAHHVYSLAQHYGLCQEMVQAARITLKFTLTIESLEGKLDDMPGDHLYELWRYHQRVKDNLMADLHRFRDSDALSALRSLDCFVLSSDIPKWIDDYIVSVASDPSLFDLTKFQTTLARHVSRWGDNGMGKDGCSYCAYIPGQKIDEFWMALTTFVHANMEMVSIIGHVDYIALLIQALAGRISILHPQGKYPLRNSRRQNYRYSTPARGYGD